MECTALRLCENIVQSIVAFFRSFVGIFWVFVAVCTTFSLEWMWTRNKIWVKEGGDRVSNVIHLVAFDSCNPTTFLFTSQLVLFTHKHTHGALGRFLHSRERSSGAKRIIISHFWYALRLPYQIAASIVRWTSFSADGVMFPQLIRFESWIRSSHS